MVYTLRFLSSKCSLFHNSNVFGSCIIHILYTVCAKIKKNNSGAKRLTGQFHTSAAELPVEEPQTRNEVRLSWSRMPIYTWCLTEDISDFLLFQERKPGCQVRNVLAALNDIPRRVTTVDSSCHYYAVHCQFD